MSPYFASANLIDRRLVNSKLPSNSGVSFTAVMRNHILNHGADLTNVLLCQLGRVTSFPFSLPSLVNLIRNIVGTSSGKQMARVYARRVVAVVKNTYSVRNSAIVNLPTKTGGNAVAMFSAEPPVTLAGASGPVPASVGAIYFLPKTGNGTIGIHRESFLLGVMLRAVSAVPEFSLTELYKK